MRADHDTRVKLLTTAVDLIWEHSYGSVSVDDICKRAGVLKGSFYHFFPSKSDLAVAAYDEYWIGQRQSQLDHAFSPVIPALERFARYCIQVYDNQRLRLEKAGRVCGCPFSAIGSELSGQDEKIRLKSKEIADRICQYFMTALRDGMQEGTIEQADPAIRARELYSLVTGTLLQARIHDDLERVRDLTPALERLIGSKKPALAKLTK